MTPARLLVFVGGQYEPTSEDRLWLLRAVQVEGRPHELVARTLVNGFCWARSERTYPGSLTRWVRSYAQPVNPRWFIGGDLHELHCAGLQGRPELQVELRRAEARQTRHSSCESFDEHVRLAVERALATPWRSDWTDYAAPHIDATRKGYIPRTEVKRGENRFWTRAPGWTGYQTTDARGVA